METIYWIDSAGFSQHCTEAYPNFCDSDDSGETSTRRDNKKYTKLIEGKLKKLNFDYSENQKYEPSKSLPLPIRIPDYEMHLENGKRLITYHIYMAGYKIASRLDGEFKNLYSRLLTEFFPYAVKLPKFPAAAGGGESGDSAQLEFRREQLEEYLYDLCRLKMIAESDLVQDFLSDSEDALLSDSMVELRVKLPDKVVVNVTVKKSTNAEQFWKVLVLKARLSVFTQEFFYLFENVDRNFDRKLQSDEIPYFIYTQNYSNALDTCLIVRRWLFSVEKELFLSNNEQALSFIYHQEINDNSRRTEETETKIRDLCTGLSNSVNPVEYLKLIRSDPSYGYIEFPHCSSDLSKSICVVPSVGLMSFRLHPCRHDSAYDMDIIEFMWDHIVHWKCDTNLNTFSFQISEDQMPGKWIKLFTIHYAYLAECFKKVMDERVSINSDPFM